MTRTAWALALLLAAGAGVVALYVSRPRGEQTGGRARAFDASVTFAVKPSEGPDRTTTAPCRTSLTVAKAGRTALVEKEPGAAGPDVYGWHNFPEGSTGEGVAAYYAGWLANNGWRQPEDFTVSANVISFVGVGDLAAGRDNDQIVVTRSPAAE
jgi:hypothetical protein